MKHRSDPRDEPFHPGGTSLGPSGVRDVPRGEPVR